MSLSSSLNFAVTGLDFAARRAEIVARNVSASDQPGYASRRGEVVGAGLGMPGSGIAVSRSVDPRLVQLRREAQSAETGEGVGRAFHARLDAAIGAPDEAGSLQDRLARLDAAFLSAAGDPTSATRLGEVSAAADRVAKGLNDLDRVVQGARQDADADIGRAVSQIDSDLADVARLNTNIRRLSSGGHDTADLLDRRTVLIDRVSRQIPLHEIQRDGGTVALVSKGGVILLDGKPATFGFASRAPITPAMSAPVQLSGLTVNGSPVRIGATGGIPGGGLDALFALRDVAAPQATARLDALAADLVARFAGPAVDPTLPVGAPGIFTDGGGPRDVDPGLAGRIAINASVAPDRPEGHWRLRDGLNAAMPGDRGNPSLLLAYGARFADRSAPVDAALPAVPGGVADLASMLRSLISADRVRADDRTDFARRQSTTLVERRDGGAVDVDGEMRRLIEIEQAYAANARVIQVVGDMINRLTEL